MYHQIAHNKRNSIILIVLFLLVWLLAGFVIGEFGGGTSTAILGAIILGLLGVGAAAYSYYLGAATVLAAVGAREADPQQYQQLYNIVQTLAIGDGVPVPKVYIVDDASPNAFATGRDRRHLRSHRRDRRTDHADGVVAAARVARGCQRRRAHPQPARPAERTEEDRPERQADAEVQPRGGCDVHRQPEGAPRQLP